MSFLAIRVWDEITVDKAKATKDKLAYTGTFTVGRYKPLTRVDAERNNLGLCVTAYDIRGQSS